MDPSTTPTVFGRSLRLADGDLPFEEGDLSMIAGRENFLQGMEVMIETPFATDVFNVNYGFDILGILSTPDSVNHIKSLIRLNIVKSISQDNRVREITEVVFDDEDRFFELQPDQTADEHRQTRKRERRWQALVVLQTITEGEVVLRLDGTGVNI